MALHLCHNASLKFQKSHVLLLLYHNNVPMIKMFALLKNGTIVSAYSYG